MNVKELIEQLKEMPQDYIVAMADYAPITLAACDNEQQTIIFSDYCNDEDITS